MKKVVPMVVAVMLLVCAGMAFAFQNEPKGFRKVYWGNSPTSTMEYVDDIDEFMKVYDDPSASNKLGDARFYRVVYTFYLDQNENLNFTGVTLLYNSEKNFEILKTLCTGKFGEASDKGYDEFFWEGMITTVHLKFDSIEENGWLSLNSTRLWHQYTERKEQKQVEDAEGDW